MIARSLILFALALSWIGAGYARPQNLVSHNWAQTLDAQAGVIACGPRFC